jgi:uncharacterized protein (TIGR02001 family)
MRGVLRSGALICGCWIVVPAAAADLGLPAKAPPAPAVVSPWDVAFGAAVMTDYNFRGITQSNHKPSVAAYVEPRYNFNDNLQTYAGVSGESISFPNRAAAEVDVYAGIRPTFGNLALDFGFWDFYYPGGQCFNAAVPGDCTAAGNLPNLDVIKADVSFWEVYGKATYIINDQLTLGGSAFWSPSVLNSGARGIYVAATAKYNLPAVLPQGIGWFVSADAGRWFLGTSDSFYGTAAFPGGIPYQSYTNWDAGIAFTWKQFTLDLRYFGTDLGKGDCNAFTSDHTATGFANASAINAAGAGSNWCGTAFIAKISVDLTAANLK